MARSAGSRGVALILKHSCPHLVAKSTYHGQGEGIAFSVLTQYSSIAVVAVLNYGAGAEKGALLLALFV